MWKGLKNVSILQNKPCLFLTSIDFWDIYALQRHRPLLRWRVGYPGSKSASRSYWFSYRHILYTYLHRSLEAWKSTPKCNFKIFYTQEFYNQTKHVLSIKLILPLEFSKIPQFIYICFELMSPEIFFCYDIDFWFQMRFYYSIITSWRSYLARRAILASTRF